MAILMLLGISPICAQTFSVIYTFCSQANCADGMEPAGVILGADGNLYGGTVRGGSIDGFCNNYIGCGVVFQITPNGTENVLYTFDNFANGFGGFGTLLRDADGNLYGAAGGGYDKNIPCVDGCGLVYELSATGTETVLHAFKEGRDGKSPNTPLVRDGEGNFYGTTIDGGHSRQGGTAFKLSPDGTNTVLHEFGSYRGDGFHPQTGVITDAQGNLYGTTILGGSSGKRCCGTVFEIYTAGVETILYSFKGSKTGDAEHPDGGLLLDAQGNLFGTTEGGGAHNSGTVYKLAPSGQETVLYSFTGGADGFIPYGSLVQDAQGNLYGTTFEGGTYDFGTVYEVTPAGTEKVLYSFTGGADGRYPVSGLALDSHGALYGVTPLGGNMAGVCSGFAGCGVLFKVTP